MTNSNVDSSHPTCEFYLVAAVDENWDFGVMGYAESPQQAIEKAKEQFEHLRYVELKVAVVVQVQRYEPPVL